MVVRSLPGVPGTALLDALRTAASTAWNLRGAHGTAIDRFNQYQQWANQEVDRFGRLVPADELDRLVTTRRYWALQTLDPASHGHLTSFVDVEVDERVRVLEREVTDLDRALSRWRNSPDAVVVADTNVYLHHPEVFLNVPWRELVPARMGAVQLVIPLLVVDELDRHKRSARSQRSGDGPTALRTRARVTLREIDELFTSTEWTVTLSPAGRLTGLVRASLLLDPPEHARLPDADSELIDRARSLQDLIERPVNLVTYDTGMTFRARAAGLKPIKLAHE